MYTFFLTLDEGEDAILTLKHPGQIQKKSIGGENRMYHSDYIIQCHHDLKGICHEYLIISTLLNC